MRILQVTSYYYPELQFGGPPQKIHALSQGLLASGNQVKVITFHSERPEASEEAIYDEVNVQYIPWIGKGNWQLPIRLSKIVQAVHQADIIHIYGLYNLLGPIVVAIAKKMGKRFIIEPQGMYSPRAQSKKTKWFYHQIFTNWMIRSAALVIAHSSAEDGDLAPFKRHAHITVRSNGVNLTQFEKLPSPDVFRSRYNIAADDRIILFLGRISPIKNLKQMVSAFHEASLPKTHFMLAGPILEEAYAAQLRSHIDTLGIANQVILTGPLYDQAKLAALASADLFVLPSAFESYGNAAAEAVAAGIPVLITETCGIAPKINMRAGLSVALSQKALADGLRIFLEHPDKAKELTSQQAQVQNELSWTVPLQQMEKLYQEALDDLKFGESYNGEHSAIN